MPGQVIPLEYIVADPLVLDLLQMAEVQAEEGALDLAVQGDKVVPREHLAQTQASPESVHWLQVMVQAEAAAAAVPGLVRPEALVVMALVDISQ